VLVAGQEDGTSLAELHPLDGVLPVDEADGLAAAVGLHGAVHDDDVPFVHVGVDHRHAVDAEEEGRGAVAHQELHQVELFPEIVRRRGESRLDAPEKGFKGIARVYRIRLHGAKVALSLAKPLHKGRGMRPRKMYYQNYFLYL